MDQLSPLTLIRMNNLHQVEAVWEDDAVLTLIRMLDEGCSMGAIANAVNKTRAAVAGKINRLRNNPNVSIKPKGLARVGRKPKPVKRVNMRSVPRMPKIMLVRTTAIKTSKPLPPPIKVKRVRLKMIDHNTEVTFQELQKDQCKWPLGDPRTPEFRFCGQPRLDGSHPYCQKHTKEAKRLY